MLGNGEEWSITVVWRKSVSRFIISDIQKWTRENTGDCAAGSRMDIESDPIS